MKKLILIASLCLFAGTGSASADACANFPNDGGPAVGPNGECVDPNDIPDGSVDEMGADEGGCSVGHSSASSAWGTLLLLSVLAVRRKRD